ncbi:MAG: hypothetical protein HY842_08030 [Bacteroidetes bacterium]|nr:hypothetical protein [Bacteroidota bacterium]
MKRYLKSLAMLGWLVLPLLVFAQTEKALLAQLLEEEQKSVEALALYPAPTRVAILEAAKYPEALIKLESLQGKTSATFKSLLENYPKATQEKVWDLTRYPGLVAAIVEGGQKWGIDFDVAVQDFPKEIIPRAREVSADYYPLLTEVHRLNGQWSAAYNDLLATYAQPTRDALQQLVDLPEVLTLLTDNIRLTVLVGDLYRQHPAWLMQQMDSLGIVVAEARAKELEEWNKSMEEDPAAKEELEQAAKDYTEEYGYDDAYYDYDDDLYYNGRDRYETVVEYAYYYYNYPYWFGYPHWYPYPRWRPYPYWYDWGFYQGPGNVIIIIDLPSYWFVDWYFYYPWHHYYYPHLSSHYVNHYYGHRTSSSSITTNVKNWQGRTREVVTDEWLNKARTDANSFREYGKFETEREKYNRSHADKPATPEQYLEKNNRRYPDLSKAVERKQEQPRTEPKPPMAKPTEPKKPDMQPRKEPVKPAPRKEEPRKQPTIDLGKVEQAQKHHQDAWEKSKRETTPRPQVEKPKVQPPKLKPPKQAPAPRPERKPFTGGQKGRD